MATFYKHAYCAHCHEKGKGTDPCTMKTEEHPHCNILALEQKLHLAIHQKKEKCELKEKAEESSSTLVDLALISVLGVAKEGRP